MNAVYQRIAATPLWLRFLLVVLIELGYVAASHIIASSSTTLIEAELSRTPLRLAAAFVFWLLMRDIILAPHRSGEAPRHGYLAAILVLSLATPLLIGGYNLPPFESIVVAAASIPVALAEELFFRGILQNLAVKRWGLWPGLAVTIVLFIAFHIGVVRGDFFGLAQPALMGLILGMIYYKTGSLFWVIGLHTIYDALDSVPRFFPAPDRMWGLALLIPAAALAFFWASNARARH